MTRIVFVGVGGMGQMAHLKNYAVLPDVKVVAVVEARRRLADAVAARYAIPNVFYDLDAFRASGVEFDGIVSAQQYRNMAAIVPELLSFGKPLFTEKPLALSIEAAERLAEEADRNHTTHMVGYHKRSDPAMEFAKSLSDKWRASGEFGRLRYIRVTMPAGDWVAAGFDGMIATDDPYPQIAGEPNVKYWANDGYNTEYDSFVNYYIHQVNALRFLLGEDYGVTYADPAGVTLNAVSASGVPAVIELSPWTTTVDWQEEYLVAFEHGWIKVGLPAPLASNRAGTVTVFEDNSKQSTPVTWQPTLPHVHAMKNQAANFVRFIRGEHPVPCDSHEAVKDLKIARDYINKLHS